MSLVAHDNDWNYDAQGNPFGTLNPSSAGLFFTLSLIRVPLNLRHRRFFVMLKTGVPSNQTWLKLLPVLPVNLPPSNLGAGSILTNGISGGLPQYGSNDINIQLTQGNQELAIQDWRWSMIGEPGEDSGGASLDAFTFGAHTNLWTAYENVALNRSPILECDCAIAGVALIYSDGQTTQHQLSWFLGCESSSLPQNMYHENHFETVF